MRALRARLATLETESNGLAWCPHEPHPKQAQFLTCEAFEAFYGGAAGGGKSDALLMAALQFVHVPGYSALIIRRTFPDLNKPGAIMDRAREWLIPQEVKWNGDDKRFTFPSGATLSFGYLDSDKDRYQYQGAELQFVGFDEVTQLPEPWYLYLVSRVRRPEGLAVPLRVRSAGNPGGIGHGWVKRRFVDANDPASRAFIPARLADNPSLDQEEYTRTLELLDPVTRRQLLEGIWVQDGSGLVYRQFDEIRNLIDAAPRDIKYRAMGIDYGLVDDCAWTVIGWRPHDPITYVLHCEKRGDFTAVDAAEYTAELLAKYPCVSVVGDVGGLGKGYAEEARRRTPPIPVMPADKLNKRGYIDLLNGALSRGMVKLVRDTTVELAREWRELPWDKKHEHEAPGADNHCADSALYAWRASNSYTAKPEPEARLVVADRFQRNEAAYLKAKASQGKRPDLPWWKRAA